MYFVIGADFVPSKTNEKIFSKGDAVSLIGGQLYQILSDAEFRIFNLEEPLTDQENPIEKCGPNLIASPKTIAGYKACGVDVFTLANNHILDQGRQGLIDTCEILERNKINYLGAGENIQKAQKPYLFSFAGKRVGIYACAEHEFTIATERKAGANPFDPLESLDHIEQLKHQCDYEIVLYHGGKEHYQYPSPLLQRTCRKMVDKGADLVICQHTHCIGCEEKWKNGTIVYGQGNFLFDDCGGLYASESVLLKVDESFQISYLPIKKGEGCVCLAEGDDGTKILNGMNDRSIEIFRDGFVEQSYKKYAEKMCISYLSWFSELSRWLPVRILNRITKGQARKQLLKRIFTKKRLLIMENYIECEAHRELFLQIICNLRKRALYEERTSDEERA